MSDVLSRAREHLSAGRYAEARDILASVQAAQNDNSAWMALMGRALIGCEDTESAEELLARALIRDPENLDAWMGRAEMQAQFGEYNRACATLRKLISREGSEDPLPWIRLGTWLLLCSQAGEAVAVSRRGVLRFPESAELSLILGMALVASAMEAQAVEPLSRAAAAMPESIEAQLNYGLLLSALDRDLEAEPFLRRSVALNPHEISAHLGLAVSLMKIGKLREAESEYMLCHKLDPDDPELLFALGALYTRMDRTDEARPFLESYLQRDPDDRHGAQMVLASLGARPMPEGAAPSFVKELFDRYSGDFERHLVQDLKYDAPERIAALLRERWPRRDVLDAVDLGCGTGLVGKALDPGDAVRLIGVDLSPRMLRAASQSGAYAEVIESEAVQFLTSADRAFDLILAADVLPYLGRLEALFEAVGARLQPGGAFVFTFENAAKGANVELKPTCRYGHSVEYIRELAIKNQLDRTYFETIPLRIEGSIVLEGTLCWLTAKPI